MVKSSIRHYQFQQQKTTGVISGSRLFFHKPDEFRCVSSIIKVPIIINCQQYTYINTNNPNEISVTTQTRCKSSCHSPSDKTFRGTLSDRPNRRRQKRKQGFYRQGWKHKTCGVVRFSFDGTS